MLPLNNMSASNMSFCRPYTMIQSWPTIDFENPRAQNPKPVMGQTNSAGNHRAPGDRASLKAGCFAQDSKAVSWKGEANIQTRQKYAKVQSEFKSAISKFEWISKQIGLHCEVNSLTCKSTQKHHVEISEILVKQWASAKFPAKVSWAWFNTGQAQDPNDPNCPKILCLFDLLDKLRMH